MFIVLISTNKYYCNQQTDYEPFLIIIIINMFLMYIWFNVTEMN